LDTLNIRIFGLECFWPESARLYNAFLIYMLLPMLLIVLTWLVYLVSVAFRVLKNFFTSSPERRALLNSATVDDHERFDETPVTIRVGINQTAADLDGDESDDEHDGDNKQQQQQKEALYDEIPDIPRKMTTTTTTTMVAAADGNRFSIQSDFSDNSNGSSTATSPRLSENEEEREERENRRKSQLLRTRSAVTMSMMTRYRNPPVWTVLLRISLFWLNFLLLRLSSEILSVFRCVHDSISGM
jgi:hypothetical protein